MNDFDTFESIYWVFTHRCNDTCAHCYNMSGPQGEVMSEDDCLAIIRNLPNSLGRIILSGGEPLAERKKLYRILEALRERYRGQTEVMLQTNGDLMTPERLDAILSRGVSRIDVASIDRFHKLKGQRRTELESLFRSRGLVDAAQNPLIRREDYLQGGVVSFGFWGANEDFWIGGNWARGRAMKTGIWLRDGDHNFCSVLSGGRGFLGGTDLPQEISIQLWRINPCCPGTLHAMGDARSHKISDVLRRVSRLPVFQSINDGDPYGMGTSMGISREHGIQRARALKNVCRWCDEFFERHYDMERGEARPSSLESELPEGAA
ncbi:MAG: radical SAM protein [Myxococcota bacterium]